MYFINAVVIILLVLVAPLMILVGHLWMMPLWRVMVVTRRNHDMMMVIGSLARVGIRNPALLTLSLHTVGEGMPVTCLMAAVEDLDGLRLAG
jgi:hypothetical protein